MDLSMDSYAWAMKAALVGPTAFGLVDPSADEVMIEVLVDGHTWRFVVESTTQDESFGRRSVTCAGSSLTAMLSDRYVPARTHTSTEGRTMAQLAESELPYGWTIEWEPLDWSVPAGAWSYQGMAPIAAIGRLADSAGACVVPAMAAQSITVRPRYPILPWHYAAEVPDIVIPETAILARAYRNTPPDQADGVYVRGGEVGGILAWVKRTGTAGAMLAQERQENLITHSYGARALGERILAGQARPPSVRSIQIPLGGDFPLVSIGDLVQIGTTGVRGIVSGVAISADQCGTRVTQTSTLGEDVSAWSRWKSILPQQPLIVGEVMAMHDDGSVTVEVSGGGMLRVRGIAAEGDYVYVRGGRIEGTAPALDLEEVSV